MELATKSRDTGEDRLPDHACLVASARAAFGDIGAGATVEEIAQNVGVSAATLYERFGDRDGLVAAVLDDLRTSLGAESDPGSETHDAGALRIPRRQLRQAVLPLAAMAALLPVAAAPTAAAAEDPAPPTVLTVSPLWPVMPMKWALGGSLCESDNCDSVPYVPFWTANGVHALEKRLATIDGGGGATIDGPTIVFAYSNGALVAERWMAEHTDDPEAPSPDELSFVLIGNPRRAHGGSMPAMPPSEYQVVDVVRQYDPTADFPDEPFNLLALANVALGILSPMHLNYTGVDIDDPANIRWTEGNTTYVFVPTENLPMLAPLRLIGMGHLADALNEPLKEIVERAYDRPYLPTAEPDPEAEATSARAGARVADSTEAEDATEPLSVDPAVDEEDAAGDRGGTNAATDALEVPAEATDGAPEEATDEPADATDVPAEDTDPDADDEAATDETPTGDTATEDDATADEADETTPTDDIADKPADTQQSDTKDNSGTDAG